MIRNSKNLTEFSKNNEGEREKKNTIGVNSCQPKMRRRKLTNIPFSFRKISIDEKKLRHVLKRKNLK